MHGKTVVNRHDVPGEAPQDQLIAIQRNIDEIQSLLCKPTSKDMPELVLEPRKIYDF